MAEQWYYTSQGQRVGPVSQEQLRQLAAGQYLRPTDFIWKEGLANWIPAGSVQGLFTAGPPPQARAGAPVQSYQYTEPPASQHDEEEDFHERRPRRKKKKKRKTDAGMPVGLKIGLAIGGSVLGVTLIAVALFWTFNVTGFFSLETSGNYSANLPPGSIHTQSVYLHRGQWCTITVNSEKPADVDLFVYDPSDRLIAQDIKLNASPTVAFAVPDSGYYRFELHNVDFLPNRSTLYYKAKKAK